MRRSLAAATFAILTLFGALAPTLIADAGTATQGVYGTVSATIQLFGQAENSGGTVGATSAYASTWSNLNTILVNGATSPTDTWYYCLLYLATSTSYLANCIEYNSTHTFTTVGSHNCSTNTSTITASTSSSMTNAAYGNEASPDIGFPGAYGGAGGCGADPNSSPYDYSSFMYLGTLSATSCAFPGATYFATPCSGSDEARLAWNDLESGANDIIACTSTTDCSDGGGNWANVGTYNFGSSWTGAPTTACAGGLSISGDLSDEGQTYTSTMATNNVAYPLTLTWTGKADSYALVDTSSTNAGGTVTAWGKTFNVNGLASTGLNHPLPGGVSPPWSANYAPQSGDVYNPEIWCHQGATSSTAGGVWVDVGPLSSFTNTTGGSGVPLPGGNGGSGQCFAAATSGWEWYNPITYVTSGLQILLCLIEWLFVPSSWSSILPPGLASTPPFQWASDAISAAGTLKAGITSGLASDNCSAPSFSPFSSFTSGILHSNSTIHNFTITLPSPADAGCPNTYTNQTAGELFGYRTFFRDLELFGLLVAFLATIWKLLPWSQNSDAKIIERWGGLNDDGDYIDTYITNEGSDV